MGKAGRKYSSLEKEERVLFLLECHSKGIKGTSDLLRFFAEKYPNIGKRQFEYDLKDAKDRIMEYHAKDVDFIICDLTKSLWELYNKSMKIQDYRECRAVIREISEITGAKAATKIDHTTAGEKIEFKGFNFLPGDSNATDTEKDTE